MMATSSRLIVFDKCLQLERVYKALDLLTKFIRPALPFVNSHLTEFYTQSYWNTLLPSSLREDLESKSLSEVKEHLNSMVNGNWRKFPSFDDGSSRTFDESLTLEDLIVSTAKLQLSEMRLSVPVQNLYVNGVILYENSSPFENMLKLDKIMSPKKTHEVEVMSEFITKISHSVEPKRNGVEYLVDVGSGKGYLSSYLTLLHKFKVLAVDSSSINTAGCETRSAKLEKVWAQLVQRASEREVYGECSKRVKQRKSKRKSSARGGEPEIHENETNSSPEKDENKINAGDGASTNKPLNHGTKTASNSSKERDNKLLKTLTQFVTSDFNLTTSIKDNFITTTTNSDADQEPNSFGLVGLHTCGNLGVASLRLFISNENAKFMCNIPCCYHLLDENHLFYTSRTFQGSMSVEKERSSDSKISNNLVDSILQPSFPICRKLDVGDSTRFCLGRNARMMSAYSLPRMLSTEKGLDLHKSLFNRSLLQVLIKQALGNKYLDLKEYEHSVGKIGDKCKDFGDYVSLGLKNLHLDSTVQVSNTEIEELYASYSLQERERLHKYYLLRSIFAAIVEGIILLDRLAFLLEQDSVSEAYIVELFNPAVSPRCHALLALKN